MRAPRMTSAEGGCRVAAVASRRQRLQGYRFAISQNYYYDIQDRFAYRKIPARSVSKLQMAKGSDERDGGGSDGGGNGILFPPGLVFICAVLLPYNNPAYVAITFITGLAAFNIYARKNR